MPDEPFAPEDAMEFMGVAIPVTPEESERSLREMAQCFIEEYVRMGYSAEFILRLCRDPFYQGLYAVRQKKGEAFLRKLVDETERAWRPSTGARDATPSEVEGWRPRSASAPDGAESHKSGGTA